MNRCDLLTLYRDPLKIIEIKIPLFVGDLNLGHITIPEKKCAISQEIICFHMGTLPGMGNYNFHIVNDFKAAIITELWSILVVTYIDVK